MSNFSALLRPREGSYLRGIKGKPNQKVLQVVKMDGKIIEFRAPLLVKDVLVKFSGSGIGLSKKVSQHLPLNYELKMGKVFYILPESVSPMADTQQAGGVKKIKVVTTKQELQQLLMKQISVQEVLSGLEKRNGSLLYLQEIGSQCSNTYSKKTSNC